MSLPNKNDVKGSCERGMKWNGYRIRTLQDDLDSGDAMILDASDFVKPYSKSPLLKI